VDATADVARTDLPTCPAYDLISSLLAECPSAMLWDELRRHLPLDATARMFDLAAAASRHDRA
jgi:hypothetical protein